MGWKTELRRKCIASLVSPAAKKELIGELYNSIDMHMNLPHTTGKSGLFRSTVD